MADSMSVAASTVAPSSQQPQQTQKSVQPIVEPPKNERLQQQAKESQEVSTQKLDAAIDRLNQMMESSQRSLSYSVDKTSDKVVVQVKDYTTDQVVR